jgi:hypothetical protein
MGPGPSGSVNYSQQNPRSGDPCSPAFGLIIVALANSPFVAVAQRYLSEITLEFFLYKHTFAGE